MSLTVESSTILAYCFPSNKPIPLAHNAGVPDSKIDALQALVPRADAGPPFDEDDRLALALTDAMTCDIEVPDALFDRIRARFDDRGIVEIVTTVAAYNMVSRFLVALHIGHRR